MKFMDRNGNIHNRYIGALTIDAIEISSEIMEDAVKDIEEAILTESIIFGIESIFETLTRRNKNEVSG